MDEQGKNGQIAVNTCQVFTREDEYQVFIALLRMHKKLYGNSFTYTLLDTRAERKQLVKKVALIGTVGALTLWGLLKTLTKKKPKRSRDTKPLSGRRRRKTKKSRRWKRCGANY